ncbi:MAG: hypothetical protein EOP45_04365, partial [Sphingobacteriaceae bacterium]
MKATVKRVARPTPAGPTASTTVLLGYARAMLNLLWPGTAYHKACVVLDGSEPPGTGKQLGFFDQAPVQVVLPAKPALLTERPGLMASLD